MKDDKLPACALAKIFNFKDQLLQAQTVMRSNQSTISELQRAIGNNPHGDKAAAWTDEVARLQDLAGIHQSRHRAIADLCARIEHYFDTLPVDVEIEEAKKVKPKLKPGETHKQAVDRIRSDIAKLTIERSQVESAGLPLPEIKAQAKKWIVERAIKARPAIIATHERFDVKYTFMDPSAFAPALDPLALLAWFDPEHLETKLNELIDQMPKPQFALTPVAKAERLASISVELGSAERLECALIDAAQDEGTIIVHRPNTDIAALLGIVVSKSKANAA